MWSDLNAGLNSELFDAVDRKLFSYETGHDIAEWESGEEDTLQDFAAVIQAALFDLFKYEQAWMRA